MSDGIVTQGYKIKEWLKNGQLDSVVYNEIDELQGRAEHAEKDLQKAQHRIGELEEALQDVQRILNRFLPQKQDPALFMVHSDSYCEFCGKKY